MLTLHHTIADKIGLHARPAGMLTKQCSGFQCKISLSTSGNTADPKKVITLLSLGAKYGDELIFTFDGEDEQAAYDSISQFCKEYL